MSNLWLGIIGLSLLVMAVSQFGVLLYAARLTRRLEKLSSEIERDVKPVLARLDTISAEMERAVTVAGAQVDRVDKLFKELAGRIEQTADLLQQRLLAPAREGVAILASLRAALSAFRERRESSRRRSATEDQDDAEALFIG